MVAVILVQMPKLCRGFAVTQSPYTCFIILQFFYTVPLNLIISKLFNKAVIKLLLIFLILPAWYMIFVWTLISEVVLSDSCVGINVYAFSLVFCCRKTKTSPINPYGM